MARPACRAPLPRRVAWSTGPILWSRCHDARILLPLHMGERRLGPETVFQEWFGSSGLVDIWRGPTPRGGESWSRSRACSVLGSRWTAYYAGAGGFLDQLYRVWTEVVAELWVWEGMSCVIQLLNSRNAALLEKQKFDSLEWRTTNIYARRFGYDWHVNIAQPRCILDKRSTTSCTINLVLWSQHFMRLARWHVVAMERFERGNEKGRTVAITQRLDCRVVAWGMLWRRSSRVMLSILHLPGKCNHTVVLVVVAVRIWGWFTHI